jgi:hypothetical protein
MAKTYVVRYRGPRGGHYITPPLCEEEARALFAKLGETTHAILLREDGQLPGFGPMRTVVAQNKVADLEQTEHHLKDSKERLKRTQRAIESCKEHIMQLKKAIKAAGGKV